VPQGTKETDCGKLFYLPIQQKTQFKLKERFFMSDVRLQSFGVSNDYSGVFATNIPKQEAELDSRSLAFYTVSNPTATSGGGGFTVAEGVSVLYGGIGNWTDGEVPNASIWVQKPNGDLVDQASSPTAEGHMVVLPTENAPAGSVQNFIIIDPEPGEWTIGVNAEDAAANFQIAVTTVAAGGLTEMMQSFARLMGFDYEYANDGGESLAARPTELFSISNCTICKCVTYPIALAIAVVAAGALTTLTATSAVVVALTSLAAWITAPIAIAFITGLATAGVIVVDFVLTSLCEWLGACDS
jgi:hypothetical protein